ncbi:hypothetical protein BU16DRAFT_543610 [Lophium mytilinum]|uniref:Uncharacterized protein n=1 Tax=Lophium mytilinum TaxID=390894 RepID=A0A6A6QDB2_9PEZI|nr:hypothetical protein BU16DRAFT_543610 [Lophium mytilinum]
METRSGGLRWHFGSALAVPTPPGHMELKGTVDVSQEVKLVERCHGVCFLLPRALRGRYPRPNNPITEEDVAARGFHEHSSLRYSLLLKSLNLGTSFGIVSARADAVESIAISPGRRLRGLIHNTTKATIHNENDTACGCIDPGFGQVLQSSGDDFPTLPLLGRCQGGRRRRQHQSYLRQALRQQHHDFTDTYEGKRMYERSSSEPTDWRDLRTRHGNKPAASRLSPPSSAVEHVPTPPQTTTDREGSQERHGEHGAV